MKIEKGTNKLEYQWEEFRTFTSFNIQKDKNKFMRLSFRSKGEDVYVGEFLNEEDKKVLKESISEIINSLNLEQQLKQLSLIVLKVKEYIFKFFGVNSNFKFDILGIPSLNSGNASPTIRGFKYEMAFELTLKPSLEIKDLGSFFQRWQFLIKEQALFSMNIFFLYL